MEQLTRTQALEQGYDYAAPTEDGWTTIFRIDEISDETLDDGRFWLAGKEDKTVQLSEESVKDAIRDEVFEQEHETGVDYEKWSGDALSRVDWAAITQKINEALATETYRETTQIRLVKG